MKIAILGPGAIGGLLAALFNKRGFEVVCIDKEENLQTLVQNGIRIESKFFGSVSAKPRFVSQLDSEPDVLLITTKAPFLEKALERIDKNLAKRFLIIPLLNGIEHVDFLKLKFGENVSAGTIGCVETYSRELGQIIHVSQNAPCVTLFSGVGDRQKENVKKIADSFRQIGFDVAIMDNEKNVLWSKLVRLSALAATTAASGKELGYVRNDPEWGLVLANYVNEAVLVAKADGASMKAEEALEHIFRLPAELKSSLERDLESGKPSELDALVGAILRKCEKFNIPCLAIQNTINIVRKKYNV